jgi:hypothetical protein
MTQHQWRRLRHYILYPFLCLGLIFGGGAGVAALLGEDPFLGMALAFGGAIGLILFGFWCAAGYSLVMDDRCRCREAQEDERHYCIKEGRVVNG